MKREHIVLRTPSTNSDITKPRLLDSNGKRKSNNKIAIFSNKYNNLMSTHSLPEGSQEIHSQMTPLLKTNSDYASTQLCDSNSQRLSLQNKTITEYQPEFTRLREENLFSAMREEINNVKSRYQAKMRELVQHNARALCELRQMLTQQQRKLSEKQLIIQRLLAQKQLSSAHKKTTSQNEVRWGEKLKQSQFSYLKGRIHDIEVKVMVLIEALANRDHQTTSKLAQLEQRLIRNAGSRLAGCKNGLQYLMCQVSKKMQKFQLGLSALLSLPKTARNEDINLDSLKTSIKQIQKKVYDFCNRQWKYESHELVKLKMLLEELTQKMQQKQQPTTYLHSNYYFEDEDEFFYPSTERVYEANDDYEHFQQDSEDEGFKKQNRPPNCKLSTKREI